MPLPLVWHSWTRAANAACETINHEIENAADDDDDDDLKSKSMQTRLLSQFRQAAESGLPPSLPSPLSLTSCAHLFHFCGQAGARKCQSVRVPCPKPSACLEFVPQKCSRREGGDGGDTLNIALFGREFKRYALAPDTKTP